MIWVTGNPNNPNAMVYAQVDLPLLRNLPDTPANTTSLYFAGVDIDGLVASAVFSSGFYAQTENRNRRNLCADHANRLTRRQRADKKGNLLTNGSERIITATENITTTSGSPPTPLGVTTKLVGGGSAGKYTPGTKGGIGVSTTGLLIRVAGVIHYSGTDAYISDGSLLPSGLPGVRISQDLLGAPLTLPADGKPLAISGISGTEVVGGDILPVIRPRGLTDITPY